MLLSEFDSPCRINKGVTDSSTRERVYPVFVWIYQVEKEEIQRASHSEMVGLMSRISNKARQREQRDSSGQAQQSQPGAVEDDIVV